MLNLNPLEILVKEYGKIVCDADKKPVDEQLKLGYALIQAEYHYTLANIDNAVAFCKKHNLNTGEYAYEIANLSRCITDALKGLPIAYFVGWDTKQSGLLIQILLTRCYKSMQAFGILDNTNKDIYMGFKSILGESLTRDEIKKCVIPRFYDSVKSIINRVGKDKANKFFNAYAEMLPKPDELRELMHESWDDNATEYYWVAPDGYEIHQVVEELPMFRKNYSSMFDIEDVELEGMAKTYKVGFKTGVGKGKNTTVYYSKLGPRTKGFDKGTKSLGANLIHSLDAWIMRELIMRCARGKYYLNRLKKVTHFRNSDKIVSKKACEIRRLMNLWKETGIATVRVVKFLRKGDIIPKDYYDAIMNSVQHCPKDTFDVVAVHDEFMAHPEYILQVQKTFNLILVELYEGHYLDYVAKVFKWDKPMQVDPVDKSISEAIANADYLLQ